MEEIQNPTRYIKLKKNIYKWRENHKEEYNEYMRNTMKRAFERNPDAKRKMNLNRYYYKKECTRLNNILMPEI